MCANFNHTSTDTFSSQVFQSHKVEPDDYFSQNHSGTQQEGNMKRHEKSDISARINKIENNSLVGSVAKTMEGRSRGRIKRSTLYIIGDYLYTKTGLQVHDDGSKVLMIRCSIEKLCKGRAHLNPETLQVIKFPWIHSCTRDPDLKFQIQMENEMKDLAKTTKDNLKDIFNRVCLKNPVVGKRIEYKRISETMRKRREMIMKVDQ